MGLNFRKSIKLGKNTRLNISKTGGIGISTGTKGARMSVNKQGIRTSVDKDGVYYRKQQSWNSIEKENKIPLDTKTDIKDIKKYNFKITGKAVNSLIKKCFLWAIISFVILCLFAPVGYLLLGIDIIVLAGTFISLEKKCWKCNKENKFVDEGL